MRVRSKVGLTTFQMKLPSVHLAVPLHQRKPISPCFAISKTGTCAPGCALPASVCHINCSVLSLGKSVSSSNRKNRLLPAQASISAFLRRSGLLSSREGSPSVLEQSPSPYSQAQRGRKGPEILAVGVISSIKQTLGSRKSHQLSIRAG